MPAKTRLLLACVPAVLTLAFVLAPTSDQQANAAPLAAGHTYVVTSTFDAPDFDTGDGICAAANSHGCTLRAAIMQANFMPDVDTVTVPAGTFLLTRPGDEDGAVLGDLDIEQPVTVLGAGAGATIVDGNGAVTGDRIFQILESAITTTLSGMTIRNGRTLTGSFSSGGGILWTGNGGTLILSNLSVEGNQSHYGGGIELDYGLNGGSATLDNINVHANVATTAAGGGIVAVLNGNSVVDFMLRNSQVFSNAAFQGGGIYLQSSIPQYAIYTATIANTAIYSNTAGHGAGIDIGSGDITHTVTVRDSHLHHNYAAALGGAIENNASLSLLRTTVDFNNGGLYGGGLYNDEGQITVTQSTVSNNTAQFGGGIYEDDFIYNRTQIVLNNSTVSHNAASHQGGGYYQTGGTAFAYNTTIAANQIVVPPSQFYPAMGAGIMLTNSFAHVPVFALGNTLLGDNSTRVGAALPVNDDCFGRIAAGGYNLIETLTNCQFAFPSVGDITGQDPKLGPLQLNGGSTATQALLPGSPAIDAARPTGCLDHYGTPISIDQRGFLRPLGAHCDIGAFEATPYNLRLPLIRR